MAIYLSNERPMNKFVRVWKKDHAPQQNRTEQNRMRCAAVRKRSNEFCRIGEFLSGCRGSLVSCCRLCLVPQNECTPRDRIALVLPFGSFSLGCACPPAGACCLSRCVWVAKKGRKEQQPHGGERTDAGKHGGDGTGCGIRAGKRPEANQSKTRHNTTQHAYRKTR
mmetsp:Transcript_6028/g.14075  ORF Transcript_6028/g.14075 Transcript_6028/m.14075 type:complete len:166 (+) Transcript_6028:2295-2792(+)